MSLRRYLIVGGIAFVLALILDAPAATLNAWLQPKAGPRPVQFAGVSGTLHQGHMSALMFNGQPLLSEVDWKFRPWWLLLGRLDFRLDGGGDQGLFGGEVALLPGGRVSLSGVQLSAAVKPLLAAAGYPLPWLDGQATLDLSHLKLRHGIPQDATGKILLHALSWGMGAQPANLGDIAADIARDGSALVAKLSSVSGPLDLSGEARLEDDGAYASKIQLKARPDAPPPVQNLLRSMGSAPDAQGYYHLDRHGSLAPPAAAAPAPAAESPEQ